MVVRVKSKIQIKKEFFKKKGFIVARDRKTKRFVTFRRAIKGFTLKRAKEVFKRNNTFNEKIIKDFSLKNVIEIQDFRDRPMKPTRRQATKVQYFMELLLKDGRLIVARSLQHELGFSKQKMKEEATENAYYLLADSLGLGYDATKGEEAFLSMQDDIKIREGFVYYVEKRKEKIQ